MIFQRTLSMEILLSSLNNLELPLIITARSIEYHNTFFKATKGKETYERARRKERICTWSD